MTDTNNTLAVNRNYKDTFFRILFKEKTLYSTIRITIPAPRFVMFYNGKEKQPERQILKLSDLYEIPEESPMLELQVLMLNINRGNNEGLKERCPTLWEYMQYVERVRYYTDCEKMILKEAVERAVEGCIKEGILAEFLRRNKAEAIMVSLYEYDEEEVKRRIIAAERKDAKSKGHKKGHEEGRAEAKEEDIRILIETLKKYDIPREAIKENLVDEYKLKPEEAEERIRILW